MPNAVVHKVRFEPVGIEMDVMEGETVLEAGFRQGIALMHGCKEGQCSSCKSRLIEGDIELEKYSTFALPDYERDTEHILLCRTLAYSDIVVELLNFDEDLMRHSIAVKEFGATLISVTALPRYSFVETGTRRTTAIFRRSVRGHHHSWHGHHTFVLDGKYAWPWAATGVHHQEVPTGCFFCATRWRSHARRAISRQRPIRHLLSTR